MSLSTPLRPVAARTGDPIGAHEHTTSCWWDHLAGRWAGAAHPEPGAARIPAPRPAVEDAAPEA